MKLKLKICVTTFGKIKTNLIIVTVMKTLHFFHKRSKKAIRKSKDEAWGIPLTEFIAVRSKMYSYVKENYKGGRKAKGIKKNVIKKTSDMKTT